jgi:hypothetical protein
VLVFHPSTPQRFGGKPYKEFEIILERPGGLKRAAAGEGWYG